jgi:nitrogenase molybdenum-iron protein alpha/beta subunit
MYHLLTAYFVVYRVLVRLAREAWGFDVIDVAFRERDAILTTPMGEVSVIAGYDALAPRAKQIIEEMKQLLDGELAGQKTHGEIAADPSQAARILTSLKQELAVIITGDLDAVIVEKPSGEAVITSLSEPNGEPIADYRSMVHKLRELLEAAPAKIDAMGRMFEDALNKLAEKGMFKPSK